jgi:hypothetical protein
MIYAPSVALSLFLGLGAYSSTHATSPQQLGMIPNDLTRPATHQLAVVAIQKGHENIGVERMPIIDFSLMLVGTRIPIDRGSPLFPSHLLPTRVTSAISPYSGSALDREPAS